jgi:hypothetical protein
MLGSMKKRWRRWKGREGKSVNSGYIILNSWSGRVSEPERGVRPALDSSFSAACLWEAPANSTAPSVKLSGTANSEDRLFNH